MSQLPDAGADLLWWGNTRMGGGCANLPIVLETDIHEKGSWPGGGGGGGGGGGYSLCEGDG